MGRYIKYILFICSFIFIIGLFLLKVQNIERIMLLSFIIGNVLYYVVGITLAFVCKDNRAFCKYICPITVFMNPMSYFSLVRIKNDNSNVFPVISVKKFVLWKWI